ncbi:diguanylate phosphodiesterase [Photobacterium aquae]|uniref:Diguanylate phosphodiesterase n=1 Tax=Photobacterium aquae TaxID=1195763 RepID=A0A0J1K3A0_9GAMM|nr:EAL domain-containing protein [Photobacterium aquae]KLV08892.1 diguanylate phosphodiesterase [Photobacterium aquae]
MTISIRFNNSYKLFLESVFNKNNARSYLYDLSSIALLLLPITLANALAMLLGHGLNIIHYGELAKLFFHLSNLLINIYPLSFCIISAYYFSHKTNTSSVIVIIYSVVMLYLVSLETDSLSVAYYLPNNPLLALLSALLTFAYCARFNVQLTEPQSLDFATKLAKQVLHLFVFVCVALILSKFSAESINFLSQQISTVEPDPLTFTGGLVYQTLLGLLGAIGINGHNMLFATKQQLFAATELNVAAWHAGEASLNVISQGFYDAFMSMGGSGNSISLLLCILLFSKTRNHIMLALAALPLVIFNINEVLLFGLPIIFNPVMIIPFVTVPLVSFIITYACIASGLVSPVENIVNWMTPPLFSGYVAMGNNIEGALLQLFIIGVGVFIYRPFYQEFAGKYSVHFKSVAQYTSMEQTMFKNLLDGVRSSAATSINKSSAQQRLANMLRDGGLVMHYQMLQSVSDKKICSFEALIRYKNAAGKLYPPTFIGDFQLLNAMPMLDKAVIEQVLADMQQMPLSSERRVAINISVASIEQPDFVDHLLSRLQHYQISPQWLEIEITEEAILSDNVHLSRTMEALQSQGIKVAMDDFGTGYASFPHLLKYPFDKVKIDRSLLLDAVTDKGRALYPLVAQIGEIANCKIVAEGVETDQEYEFVANSGVDIVQGFLIARPQPLEDVLEALRAE